jgi:hypothetical protein
MEDSMKSLVNCVTCFACVLVLASICVSVHSVRADNAPTIPAWIRPGLVVVYDADSVFVTNGRFSQGIRMVMTSKVNSSSSTQVSGITSLQTVGSPIGGTHSWNCNAGGYCTSDSSGLNGQFWVDPANPTASKHGANGEPYTVKGTGPYTLNGKTWTGTMMVYENAASGVQLVCTFDSKTGLILQYSESSPSEQVHTYFRSMR